MPVFKPKPVVRTIIADMFGLVDQRQESEICSDFELRFAECLEAYGYPKGETKCLPYLRDLRECLFGAKQVRRCELMKRERERQWSTGELKQHYEKAPRTDTYWFT